MRRTILLLALLALTTGAAWKHGDAYVLHSGTTDVTMTSMSIEDLPPLYRRLGNGSYLWVRIDGRQYLIRDGAVLHEATTIWAPVDALRPEQREVEAEERRLDRRIDAIEDGKAKGEPGELARLRERFRTVSARERELDKRSEALEKVAEAQLRELVERAIRNGRAEAYR
jgi:hypothetical protein